jgi:lysyl-tRNA synthetase class 2
LKQVNWHLARKKDRLLARAEILHKIRVFFITRGYLEVDTPSLIPAPTLESHIDAIQAGTLYLQTSPELCMKRLLAAGYPKLFQICHCWRDKERGNRHLPEFTMLEWYRSDSDYNDLMLESIELLAEISSSYCEKGFLVVNENRVDMNGKFNRITVRDAFRLYTNTSMDEALKTNEFDSLMTESIEPYLGLEHPTVIYDYPAERAALARIKVDDPSVAERFELYIGGMELANAFSELNDEKIQRKRFIEESELRAARCALPYPMPEPFLAEIGRMPRSAGIAFGIDRVVMLLTGAEKIDDVVAFTPEDL